jgi:hypothetical protein
MIFLVLGTKMTKTGETFSPLDKQTALSSAKEKLF